jgi:UDP-glucuronate 4-epimerase
MRVLVTGAPGFIGSHVCEALLDRGDEVVGFDNFDPFYPRAVKERNLEASLGHPGFRFVEGDLRDAAAVEGLFADDPYDVVVHLAAKAGVRPSLADPVGYMAVNIGGTTNLQEAMRRAACKRLVFASSSSVYGDNEKVPFSEEDRVDRPISPYAMSKKAGEELCHVYRTIHDVRTICLRFFTVYGPRQRPEMAIHKFTRLLMAGREVPLYGDGTMERDFTYIDDIVYGVLAAVDRVGELDYEIINLGNSSPVSLIELVDLLAREVGESVRVASRPVPPGDVRRTYADVRRAGEVLGFAPRTPLEEGLRRFIEWCREAPLPAGALE